MNKKHQRTKIILKVLGIIFLIAGLTFLIWGIVDFSIKFGDFDSGVPKIWLLGIGIPLTFIGSVCTIFGFRKEVINYVKNESMHTIKDAYRDLKPEMRDFVNTVTKTETGEDKIMCSNCGNWNEPDAKFCKGCGKPLVKEKCPNCGAEVDHDAKFCSHCGHRM